MTHSQRRTGWLRIRQNPYPSGADHLPEGLLRTHRQGHNDRVPGPADRNVLVGRDAELDQLLRRADRARSGAATSVLVSGEAGMGKTRLLRELGSRLAAAGWLVTGGACLDIPGLAGASPPFAPFLEALRRLPVQHRDDAVRDWLDPSHLARPSADPVYERLTSFLDVAAGLSRRAPLLLVVEDLHEADVSTLSLLAFLVRNLSDQRLLLAATARSQDGRLTRPALAELVARSAELERLELGPLAEGHLRRLLSALHANLPEPQALTLVQRCEGNPLAVVELAAQAGHGRWSPGAELGLPPSVETSVRSRLAGADPAARAVLAAAAVIGRRVEHGLLIAVLDGTGLPAPSEPGRQEGGADPGADAELAVRQAVRTGLLLTDGDGYVFRHGLDRDAVDQALMPADRRRLHAATARALSGQGFGDPDEPGVAARVAAHWRAAGEPELARRAALQAARAAARLAAFPEALDYYEQVIAGSASTPSAVLVEAAESARLSGALDRGSVLLEGALAAPDADPAQVWERLGWFRREAGDDEGSVSAYARALDLVLAGPPTPTGARVLAAHARSLNLAGQYAAAVRQADQALAMARQVGEHAAEASALITTGTLACLDGNAEQGLATLATARRIAAEHGAPEELWRCIANTVFVLQSLGRDSEAVEVALRELGAPENVRRLPPVANVAVANAAEGLFELGRWPEAERLLDAALARQPAPRFEVQLLSCRARLQLHAGRPGDCAASLDRAAALARTMREPEDLATLCRLRAEAALAQGELEDAREGIAEARRHLEGAEELETELMVLAVALQVEADAARTPGLREPERAEELAAALARSWAATSDRTPNALLCLRLAQAEHARCVFALTGQDVAALVAAWTEHLRCARELGRRLQESYALLRLGEGALLRRRRDEAQSHLLAAAQIAAAVGAGPLLGLITELAARSRLTLSEVGADHAPGAGPLPSRAAEHGLTRREVEVLRLLALGASNRLIGRDLGMSEKTASVHVSRILTKLAVARRGEAAAAAHRLRLLEEGAAPLTASSDAARP